MSPTDRTDSDSSLPLESLISKHFGPGPLPVQVEFGAVSHRGRVRPTNEDHFMVVRRRRSRSVLLTNLPEGYLPPSADDDAYVMVVADGLGGEAFGELASRLALRTAWDLGLNEIKWTLNVSEREIEELREKAELYFRLIDRAVVRETRLRPHTTGMGTTLTIAYSVGCDAFIAHVGDSRAHLVRGGALHQLTKDHTLAQTMVDEGVLEPDAVAASSFRHVLTHCIGCFRDGVKVDVRHVELLDGDALLLCSDGLTGMVDDDTIAATVSLHPAPQAACQALIDEALERGGKDNVTAVLARYRVPGQPREDAKE